MLRWIFIPIHVQGEPTVPASESKTRS